MSQETKFLNNVPSGEDSFEEGKKINGDGESTKDGNKLLMTYTPKIAILEKILSDALNVFEKGLLKIAEYAVCDGENLFAYPIARERDFQIRDGLPKFVGVFNESMIVKKEIKKEDKSGVTLLCVLFFDIKKYCAIRSIAKLDAVAGDAFVPEIAQGISRKSFFDSFFKSYEEIIETVLNSNDDSYMRKISADDICRNAAKDFLTYIVFKTSSIESSHDRLMSSIGFYDKIVSVSLEKYEKKELFGKIAIVARNHKNLSITYSFCQCIKIDDVNKDNVRVIRKCLELTSEKYCLLYDGGFYGVGTLKKDNDNQEDDVFIIKFNGYGRWNLLDEQGEHIYLSVRNGVPLRYQSRISEEQVTTKYEGVFQKKISEQCPSLYSCVELLINQNKGGILLISDAAKEQSERLETQAILVNPFSIDANSITKLSSIDGAIMVDECGTCYAIGLIFDGMVPASGGDSSRGSRYNSSVRFTEYLKSQGKKVMTIVVSDDGMVDLL